MEQRKCRGGNQWNNSKKIGRVSRLKGITKYIPNTMVKNNPRPGHAVKRVKNTEDKEKIL